MVLALKTLTVKYCLILLLFLSIGGFSQGYYEIHTYTTKDGLSQVSINDIVQDDEGFLWIATQSGLNRFDGTSFYTFDNGDYGMGSYGNYINALLPDHNRIWIGTRATGLSYFDKKAHRLFSIGALRNFNIEGMAMDTMGNLYVTLENKGIGVLQTKSSKSDLQPWVFPYFKNKDITATAVFISKTGTLWLGTKEGRLFYGKLKSDPKEILFNEFPLSRKLEKIFVINSRLTGEIWVGTQNKLFRIDLPDQQLYSVSYAGQNTSSVIYDLKWNGDTLWVATGAGLFEYDTKRQNTIHTFVHSNQDLNSISNNVVYSLFPDQNGQLWAGTGKYLNLFYKNKVFNKIQGKTNFPGSLNSNIVFAILKSRQDLWVGTSGGGINLIRDNRRYVFTKESHQLPSNICFSLLEDKDNIWAATREGLVIIQNSHDEYRSMRVKNIFHDPQNAKSLSNNFVRYIYSDIENNIWLCTSGGGLERFTGNLPNNTIRFKHYRNRPNQTNCIASDKINYILQTDKNNYWIATDKGLSIMSFDNHQFKNASFSRLQTKDSVILDKEVVYTLLKDKDAGIWIGTTSGLYYWQNQQLYNYSINDGLPDNVVYGILEDFNGCIWISTNKGLSRYDKPTNSFTNYHQSDGLSSEEYDLHARFIDKNGLLYFGGIDGITYFDPEKLNGHQTESKLYIDNIQITNTKNNTIETIHAVNNQQVSIRQAQFPVTVNFSDINLNYYKNTAFAYRLMPDNNRWNMIKDKRSIQLLSLPPGDYTIEIQGVTKGRIWQGDEMLRIPITIVPLWWQSKWAYISYAVFILIVVYLAFRFSLRRKIEHQENLRLKEIDKLKSRLYSNITHEFRTPLTVIKGMSFELRNSLNKDEQGHFDNKLEMIERNSDKLLHLIKQMLDMSKIEDGKMKLDLVHDNIISYLQYVLESFQSMADSKNIKLVFYHETNKIVMDYDQDKIFIIASNLLSNAIKFTPKGGKIIFHVKKGNYGEKGDLVIKVQDSGIGINDEHLPHIFDRFYQIDNTSTRKGEGTGIGLALTKELVELMNGEISVKSIPGERTEFCVTLPITNNAVLKKPKPVKTQPIDSGETTLDLITENNNDKDLPLALVVEDNHDVAKYIMLCLSGKYRVLWSPDGKKGIDAALESIPDIIISDVMMPEKDGLEVCETLKQDERTSHIPIILLTARATDKDRIEGLSHGADAYLTKPFNKEELFVRLEQLIKIRRQLQEKFSKIELPKVSDKPFNIEETFVHKAVLIIEKNIDLPDFTAADLARGVHLSESQLYRKLKAISGKSTAIFIRGVRIAKALKLLKNSTLSISEIAYQVGFNDPAWFSTVFKEEFGMSPTEARTK